MGLIGRKKKDKKEDVDEESTSQEDVEEEDASLDDISLIDNNEDSSPFGASFSGPSAEGEEESDDSASVLEGLGLGALAGGDDSEDEEEEKPSSSDDDPLGGDLLSIFTDEEEAGEDLSVLTKDLEDIDINELLAELQNVAARLRAILNIQ